MAAGISIAISAARGSPHRPSHSKKCEIPACGAETKVFINQPIDPTATILITAAMIGAMITTFVLGAVIGQTERITT